MFAACGDFQTSLIQGKRASGKTQAKIRDNPEAWGLRLEA
jgi:hypothetical protein